MNLKSRSIAQFRSIMGYCVLLFILIYGLPLVALGEKYPIEGKLIDWIQPNGRKVRLRVFGDEHYARTATEEGFTVLFNSKNNIYYYAQRGRDGKTLVPSAVAADQVPPQDLEKNLKETAEVIATKRAQKIQDAGTDRSSEWAARKKAAQARRMKEELDQKSRASQAAPRVQSGQSITDKESKTEEPKSPHTK